MSDAMQELARRLVVGHKSDGRAVYDEAVKTELVILCGKPGASVSRLARECGVRGGADRGHGADADSYQRAWPERVA